MASSLIHVAVCNELNKELKRDTCKILIGTIAPDISKLVGETKLYTHFLDKVDDDVPNLKKFLAIYKDYLDDDFVLGYYIHLYTDYLWKKYFIDEIYNPDKNLIIKINGEQVKCTPQQFNLYIYNDYTNINEELVKQYNIDLDFLYGDTPDFKNIITEAHMDQINLIIDKAKYIYENSKVYKDMVFNMDNINKFINTAIKYIESDLKELDILKEV